MNNQLSRRQWLAGIFGGICGLASALFLLEIPKARATAKRQLDSCLVERGTLQVNRLRRSPIIALFPWNVVSETERDPKPVPMEPRDPLKLARYYQSLLGSGRFESRAALARYLGVSRPRVTQVLRRLGKE